MKLPNVPMYIKMYRCTKCQWHDLQLMLGQMPVHEEHNCEDLPPTPCLIAENIIGVQPMDISSTQVFTMRHVYGSQEKDSTEEKGSS
jgi:hypothetical protein